MSQTIRKRTFSLPSQQSDYLDGLVEKGRYATASEVVRAGLHALQERDGAIDQWLEAHIDEVHQALADGKIGDGVEEASTADSKPVDFATTTDEIFKALRARIASSRDPK
jgi:putative addiction module CopG family antidote